MKVELPGAAWQRCVVHFERNILAHVPQTETKAVAADLKVIFQAARRETAETLAASFAERYRGCIQRRSHRWNEGWTRR